MRGGGISPVVSQNLFICGTRLTGHHGKYFIQEIFEADQSFCGSKLLFCHPILNRSDFRRNRLLVGLSMWYQVAGAFLLSCPSGVALVQKSHHQIAADFRNRLSVRIARHGRRHRADQSECRQ
jgi:hypothetical protein